MFPCESCNAKFTRKSNLVRHTNEVHFRIPQKHYIQTHGSHIDCTSTLPQLTENQITRIICGTAYNNSVRTIRFITDLHLLPQEFFMYALPIIESTIQQLKEESCPLKLQCAISVTFIKGDAKDESYFSVKTQPIIILNIYQVIDSLNAQIEQYTTRGSEWTISKTNFFQMIVSNYQCI